jgi:hypothetical protein
LSSSTSSAVSGRGTSDSPRRKAMSGADSGSLSWQGI